MEKESIDGLSDRQAELGDKEDRSERERGERGRKTETRSDMYTER